VKNLDICDTTPELPDGHVTFSEEAGGPCLAEFKSAGRVEQRYWSCLISSAPKLILTLTIH
jgi:hypothetical protein